MAVAHVRRSSYSYTRICTVRVTRVGVAAIKAGRDCEFFVATFHLAYMRKNNKVLFGGDGRLVTK